jgi:hypothetical protein
MSVSAAILNSARNPDGKVDVRKAAEICAKKQGKSFLDSCAEIQSQVSTSEIAKPSVTGTKAYSGTSKTLGATEGYNFSVKSGKKHEESLLNGVTITADKYAGDTGFGVVNYTV